MPPPCAGAGDGVVLGRRRRRKASPPACDLRCGGSVARANPAPGAAGPRHVGGSARVVHTEVFIGRIAARLSGPRAPQAPVRANPRPRPAPNARFSGVPDAGDRPGPGARWCREEPRAHRCTMASARRTVSESPIRRRPGRARVLAAGVAGGVAGLVAGAACVGGAVEDGQRAAPLAALPDAASRPGHRQHLPEPGGVAAVLAPGPGAGVVPSSGRAGGGRSR